MGIFDFLKAKKKPQAEDVPLPPPPPMAPGGDIPDIYPQLPEMPKQSYYAKQEKPEYYQKPEKAEYYAKQEKPEYYQKPEKAEYYAKQEKPEYYNKPLSWESAPVFDKTIRAEPEAPSAPRLRPHGPGFVSVDEYRKVMEHANKARARLFEAEELVRRLGELKVQEEREFDKWRAQLEDIEKKLSYVDSVIAKAKA